MKSVISTQVIGKQVKKNNEDQSTNVKNLVEQSCVISNLQTSLAQTQAETMKLKEQLIQKDQELQKAFVEKQQAVQEALKAAEIQKEQAVQEVKKTTQTEMQRIQVEINADQPVIDYKEQKEYWLSQQSNIQSMAHSEHYSLNDIGSSIEMISNLEVKNCIGLDLAGGCDRNCLLMKEVCSAYDIIDYKPSWSGLSQKHRTLYTGNIKDIQHIIQGQQYSFVLGVWSLCYVNNLDAIKILKWVSDHISQDGIFLLKEPLSPDDKVYLDKGQQQLVRPVKQIESMLNLFFHIQSVHQDKPNDTVSYKSWVLKPQIISVTLPCYDMQQQHILYNSACENIGRPLNEELTKVRSDFNKLNQKLYNAVKQRNMTVQFLSSAFAPDINHSVQTSPKVLIEQSTSPKVLQTNEFGQYNPYKDFLQPLSMHTSEVFNKPQQNKRNEKAYAKEVEKNSLLENEKKLMKLQILELKTENEEKDKAHAQTMRLYDDVYNEKAVITRDYNALLNKFNQQKQMQAQQVKYVQPQTQRIMLSQAQSQSRGNTLNARRRMLLGYK